MQRRGVDGVHADDVAAAVGPETYARGREYLRQGAVGRTVWQADGVVRAGVRGSRGRTYTTVAYFDPVEGGREFGGGECSCPMGVMCKHVTALALSVLADRRTGPSWEGALDTLLAPAAPAADEDAPLALELSLAPGADGTHRLHARLMRPGKRGWVNGGLAWNRVDELLWSHDQRPAHVALAQELYALHEAGSGTTARHRYYAYYGEQKEIDLSAVTSRRFWPWLDDAVEAGLALLQPRRGLGVVEGYGRAALPLDVTASGRDGALALAPALFLDGAGEPDADARPVAFLADHGVVHVSARETADEAEPSRWRLRLARLDTPVPPGIAAAALGGQVVTVPAAQIDRFLARYGPRLGAVTSSDGSFTPPAISAPVLSVHLAYGERHELDVSWAWSYDVGGVTSRAELGPPGRDEHFRDAAAERAAMRTVEGLPVDWGRFGLRGAAWGTASFAPAHLSGLDTVAFVTEALPVLEGCDAVRVERRGEPADYREVGDELRIGLSTTASSEASGSSGTDWFDLGVTVTAAGQEVPFAALFTALAAGEAHLLLADGAYFSLEKPELQALRALIDEARSMQESPAGPLRVSRFQAGWWEELAALGVVDRQARAWREQIEGLRGDQALDPPPVPASLAATLRPYQREGFEWLAFLWRHRLGGVLADDMGLGKTVQALALICHVRERDPDAAPFLIVAPTSVVHNWATEAARFAPSLRVATLTDSLARRGEDLATAIGAADVVVTSYTLFRIDADAHEAARWAGVLFDEAQFLKNRRSKVYQCARRVRAPFTLAITGTPMENDLMELWALLSVTAPGLFPSPTRFRDAYARPIEKGTDAELLARFRRRIRPLMTRRTKEQVSPELPEKQEQVIEVELTPAHRRLYQRRLQRERGRLLGLLDDVDKNRFTILQSITRLRQLSLHPALVDSADAGVGSTKIDVLVEQLRDVIAGGHRALVFSQFTAFLAHVRAALDDAGIPYAYLDGTSRARGDIVASFREGTAPVFLISLKAGGFGLNLVEADYCFLLDPWWNPATEEQAIDRAHRIGQQRTVMVYRLIAQDTIEEKVRALAARKAELVAGVLDDGELFARSLDADDIRALVS